MRIRPCSFLRRSTKSEGGFTLVEIAIVLVISGFLTGIAINAFLRYQQNLIGERTEEALELSQNAIGEFVATRGYYPCPARLDVGPGHPEFGFSQLNPDGTCDLTNLDTIDPDGDPTTDDTLFVGAVPHNTIIDPDGVLTDAALQAEFAGLLAVDEADRTQVQTDRILTIQGQLENPGAENTIVNAGITVDGYNNKLTYVVLGDFTVPGAVDGSNRGVAIVDENNQPIFFDQNTGAPFLQDMVLISHGEFARGAFTLEGAPVESCFNSVIDEAAGETEDDVDVTTIRGTDLENCNRTDNIFLSGLLSENPNRYNDDAIKTLKFRAAQLWTITGANLSSGALMLANTNAGNVGVGETDPSEKLHINGDMIAFELLSNRVCNTLGRGCMPVNIITGNEPAMQCPPGQAIFKIEGNAVNDGANNGCRPVFSGAVTNLSCPAGEVLVGFSNRGNAVCVVPD